jgi:hypothetical protein
MSTDFKEKLYAVALGVLLSFVLQILVALSKVFWDRRCFYQQLSLFGCRLRIAISDGVDANTDWHAQHLAASFCSHWRSKAMREDFLALLAIYIYAKNGGYAMNPEGRSKGSDIGRIDEIVGRW